MHSWVPTHSLKNTGPPSSAIPDPLGRREAALLHTWPLSEGPTWAGVPTHRHHMCKGSAFPAKTETLQFGFSLGNQPQLPPQLRIRGPGLLCWPSWACHQLQLRSPFPEFQVGGPGAAQSSLIPYSPPPRPRHTHVLTHSLTGL